MEVAVDSVALMSFYGYSMRISGAAEDSDSGIGVFYRHSMRISCAMMTRLNMQSG